MIDLFRTDGTLKARGKLLADLQDERTVTEYKIWKQTHDETLMEDVVVGQDTEGIDIIRSHPVNVFVATVIGGVDLDAYLATNIAYNKIIKTKALSGIKVTTSIGNTFDGNETARLNMVSAINSAQFLGLTEANWKLADNTVVPVTLAELQEALALSIQEVGRVVAL
jgi:hypothetical protein